MPTLFVKIPQGSFPGESRSTLVRKLNDAAAAAEQMPDDPRARAMCWCSSTKPPPAHGPAAAWT